VGNGLTFPAFCKAFANSDDLEGEFPGWYEDDCACTKGMDMASAETLYQGDHVRKGLSRTRASHAHEIAWGGGQEGGDSCALDWGWRAISLKCERTE